MFLEHVGCYIEFSLDTKNIKLKLNIVVLIDVSRIKSLEGGGGTNVEKMDWFTPIEEKVLV